MNQPHERYSRQIRFTPIGAVGQTKLAEARAVVIGMGALGSVLAQHLVRSGVGFVRIIDRDIVEWSNLQRQMLYTEQDAMDMLPKADAAAARLRAINSEVDVQPIAADLSSLNAEELLDGADLILDGTDNFSVRYLINDYSVKYGVPWIYGGAVGASGMTMTVVPGDTPCYRCLFPEHPLPGAADTCETAGVISPVIDVIASIQATEALKLLSGRRETLHRTLMQIDLWSHSWLPLAISNSRRLDCPTCALHQFDHLSQRRLEPIAAALCGRQSVHITPAVLTELQLEAMENLLSNAGEVTRNAFLLKLKMSSGMTFVLFRDGRAIIQGTEDSTKARSIYAELLGI
ncbi:ThiF family adenylyltransferase [Paenibacillus sp. GCM10027627]|uniref:ThiF family adenylyltransferase n=1 Tax=unclassified Paenibacillus TaxID=185978 RepID=UPI00362E4762